MMQRDPFVEGCLEQNRNPFMSEEINLACKAPVHGLTLMRKNWVRVGFLTLSVLLLLAGSYWIYETPLSQTSFAIGGFSEQEKVALARKLMLLGVAGVSGTELVLMPLSPSKETSKVTEVHFSEREINKLLAGFSGAANKIEFHFIGSDAQFIAQIPLNSYHPSLGNGKLKLIASVHLSWGEAAPPSLQLTDIKLLGISVPITLLGQNASAKIAEKLQQLNGYFQKMQPMVKSVTIRDGGLVAQVVQ